MSHPAESSPTRNADILAIGFGTTVAMWGVAYVCRLPPPAVPSSVLLVLLLVCLLAGGFVAGRYTRRGVVGGAYIGIVSAILNLLILGSLLSSTHANRIVPSALWWLPGAILVSMILATIGAAVGRALSASWATAQVRAADTAVAHGGVAPGASDVAGHAEINWTAAFAGVAATATLILVIAGGVVTSAGAGLAVVDWPNSFGWNMFLYPLARMTGGIYYEHAHRLLGSLVGLTTLVLTVHLLRTEERRWVKWLMMLTFLAVVVQGILGGLRVTGRFTWSTSPADTAPSLVLAVVHGTLGQAVFGMLVAIGVFTSTTWRQRRGPVERLSVPTDRAISVALVGLLVVQLVLGAMQRHFTWGLLTHITLATIVVVVAVGCGARAWGLYADQRVVERLGRALLLLITLQVILGIGALIVTGAWPRTATPPRIHVIIATAHQAVGALLLACAVMLLLWSHRLLVPYASDHNAEATHAGVSVGVPAER
jgi:cytochrome c oxidase assembly protein subunit 15